MNRDATARTEFVCADNHLEWNPRGNNKAQNSAQENEATRRTSRSNPSTAPLPPLSVEGDGGWMNSQSHVTHPSHRDPYVNGDATFPPTYTSSSKTKAKPDADSSSAQDGVVLREGAAHALSNAPPSLLENPQQHNMTHPPIAELKIQDESEQQHHHYHSQKGRRASTVAAVGSAGGEYQAQLAVGGGVTTSAAPTSAAPTSTAATSTAAAAAASTNVGISESMKRKLVVCNRPAVALSVHLILLHKKISEIYCRQRRMEGPGTKYNNGYDDSEGHYLVISGEEILSRYTVQEVLGKGSFGTVLRCYDEKRRENVALKITRHGLSFRTQAKLELDILLKLNSNPQLNHLVVKLLKVFDWQGHLVLVFELLSFNLYQLIKCTRYNGVTLDLVRKFAYQLVQVLYQLEQTIPSPIIHCDLKPENILLRNQNRSGIRLIDFGSACYTNKILHKYIQSRFYRSPEVILHLPYGTAIDRWSLGCVLVELHTGMPLFDGHTEAAQLARFEAILGQVPQRMLDASPKVLKFYDRTDVGYRLKESPLPRNSLENVLGVIIGGPRGSRKGQAGHEEHVYRQFHDFIVGLLKYEPLERLSCYNALRHPFLEPLWSTDQQVQQRAQQQAQQQRQQQESAPAHPQ